MKHETGAVLFTINLQSLATFYERVMDMRVLTTADDHICLETGGFQLIVHQIPEHYARNIKIQTPPVLREAAAVKLAFRVKSISKAREVASGLGGTVHPPEREWSWQGSTVCDGYDPDGNVFQLWQYSAPKAERTRTARL
jgi:predicted enzyme related to lactoylglutathione lyase